MSTEKLKRLASAIGSVEFHTEGFDQIVGNGTFYGGLIVHEDGETLIAQCVLEPWASYIAAANPKAMLELIAELEARTPAATDWLSIARKHGYSFPDNRMQNFVGELLKARSPAAPVVARSEILAARAEGRAEAVSIILMMEPENALDDCTIGSGPCPASGEYDTHWDEAKLREVFQADDLLFDMQARAEMAFYEYQEACMVLRYEAEQRRALKTAAPVVAEGLMLMDKEDANNYSRILSLLGMEEEGDAVAEVSRLLAAHPIPGSPAEAEPKYGPVETVADMVRNLRTLDQAARAAEPMPASEAQTPPIEQWRLKGTSGPWYDVDAEDKDATLGTHNGYEKRKVYLAAPVPASEAASDNLAEGIEILESLIANIKKGGNYSEEATITFLSQIRQCLAGPAAPTDAMPKGGA